MMVCGLFAVFWLSFGMLQLPTLGLAAPYSTTGTNAVAGAASPEFNAVIALYLIVWGFALFTFFIFTLKTNTVFALIFLFVTVAAWVLSGAYWKVSQGHYEEASHLQKVSLRRIRVRPFLSPRHWVHLYPFCRHFFHLSLGPSLTQFFTQSGCLRKCLTLHNTQQAGGALLFVVGCLGWYMTFVMMAAEMRMAITLPVGDLSHFWPKTDIEMGRAEKEA